MNKIQQFFKSDKAIESDIQYKGITKYMPLIVCGGFFLLTIFLFIFGPYDWHITNSKKLYIFLFSAFFSLVLGYMFASLQKRKVKETKYNVNNIILISFIFFIAIYICNTYSTTGKFYPDIIRGIFDSGTAYRISHSALSKFGIIVTYASIIISPIVAFLTPLFFLYFKSLSKCSRVLGIITLILNLTLGIAQGIINSYATFVFQTSLFLLLYLLSLPKKKIKSKIVLLVIIVTLLASFLGYYKVVMGNRLVADATAPVEDDSSVQTPSVKPDKEENSNNNNDSKHNVELFNGSAVFLTATVKDKYFLSFLPESVLGPTNHIISYITHGYKGLSLAMDEEFTTSYGLGFSDFFRHNFLKVIGKTNLEEKIYARTYMAKIENKGWSTGGVWSSFFIYPASDIGFPLTILLVFFIGIIFNIAWRDTLESKNIFAAVIFYNMCLMICFFSANNILFQGGGTFLTMVVSGLLWIYTRFKKENK